MTDRAALTWLWDPLAVIKQLTSFSDVHHIRRNVLTHIHLPGWKELTISDKIIETIGKIWCGGGAKGSLCGVWRFFLCPNWRYHVALVFSLEVMVRVMFETNKRHASGNIYAKLLINRLNLSSANKCNESNGPLALRGHVTNSSFKQWVGILLMPKIDRAHKNYLTTEIREVTHLREIFYGTLIFQQSSVISIDRHVGGHTVALQHGGQNCFLLISC